MTDMKHDLPVLIIAGERGVVEERAIKIRSLFLLNVCLYATIIMIHEVACAERGIAGTGGNLHALRRTARCAKFSRLCFLWESVIGRPSLLCESDSRHINFQVAGTGIVPHRIDFCWANCQSLMIAYPA